MNLLRMMEVKFIINLFFPTSSSSLETNKRVEKSIDVCIAKIGRKSRKYECNYNLFTDIFHTQNYIFYVDHLILYFIYALYIYLTHSFAK